MGLHVQPDAEVGGRMTSQRGEQADTKEEERARPD